MQHPEETWVAARDWSFRFRPNTHLHPRLSPKSREEGPNVHLAACVARVIHPSFFDSWALLKFEHVELWGSLGSMAWMS